MLQFSSYPDSDFTEFTRVRVSSVKYSSSQICDTHIKISHVSVRCDPVRYNTQIIQLLYHRAWHRRCSLVCADMTTRPNAVSAILRSRSVRPCTVFVRHVLVGRHGGYTRGNVWQCVDVGVTFSCIKQYILRGVTYSSQRPRSADWARNANSSSTGQRFRYDHRELCWWSS